MEAKHPLPTLAWDHEGVVNRFDLNPYDEMERILTAHGIDVSHWSDREERPFGICEYFSLLADRVEPAKLREILDTFSRRWLLECFDKLSEAEKLSMFQLADQLPADADRAFDAILESVQPVRDDFEASTGITLDRSAWHSSALLADVLDDDSLRPSLYALAYDLAPCDELATDRDLALMRQHIGGLRVLQKEDPEAFQSLSTGSALEDVMSAFWLLAPRDPVLAVGGGDLLAEIGREQEALRAYEMAVDAAPNRKIQSEIGYVLLLRAAVDSPPYCDDDFSGDLFSFGDGWSFTPCGQITRGLAESPSPRGQNRRLVALAFRAYGEAWAGGDAYGPSRWGQMIILDGLRSALLALEEYGSAAAVCEIAFALADEDRHLAWEDFSPTFMETAAYVRGVRTVTKRQRKDYERRFAFDHPLLARHLSPRAVELIVQGEVQRDLLRTTSGADWSPCVLQYCRGVEAELRYGVGSALRGAGVPLSFDLRKMKLSDFARLLEDRLALAHLESTAPDLSRELRGLPLMLDSIVDLRNRAAHPADPLRPEDALKLRRWLFEGREEGSWGVLRILAQFGARRAGDITA